MRAVSLSIALGVLAVALAANAQPPAKIARIGVLGTVSTTSRWEAFRHGLGASGLVEHRNFAIEYRPAAGGDAQFIAPAAELVRLKVDVLVALGPVAVRAATQATRTIPVVAIDLESDPIGSGFADSRARPGRNITGVFLDLPELAGKWLELVREAVPGRSRVAVLWNPDSGRLQLTALQSAARSLAMDLQVFEVRAPSDVDALPEVLTKRAGAVIILSAPLFALQSARLADVATKSRLPAISPFRAFAEAGGLMSYGPDIHEVYRRCGEYAGKILKGATAGELPIEPPTLFQFVINLKTAKALGLTIPPSVLLRADEVIR